MPQGHKPVGKKMVKPGMAMSPEEIIRRFTRGEPLNVKFDGEFGDIGDVDLEKAKHMDLVDKQAFVEEQRRIQTQFETQERRKADTLKRAAREKKEKLAKAKFDKAVEEAAKGKVKP